MSVDVVVQAQHERLVIQKVSGKTSQPNQPNQFQTDHPKLVELLDEQTCLVFCQTGHAGLVSLVSLAGLAGLTRRLPPESGCFLELNLLDIQQVSPERLVKLLVKSKQDRQRLSGVLAGMVSSAKLAYTAMRKLDDPTCAIQRMIDQIGLDVEFYQWSAQQQFDVVFGMMAKHVLAGLAQLRSAGWLHHHIQASSVKGIQNRLVLAGLESGLAIDQLGKHQQKQQQQHTHWLVCLAHHYNQSAPGRIDVAKLVVDLAFDLDMAPACAVLHQLGGWLADRLGVGQFYAGCAMDDVFRVWHKPAKLAGQAIVTMLDQFLLDQHSVQQQQQQRGQFINLAQLANMTSFQTTMLRRNWFRFHEPSVCFEKLVQLERSKHLDSCWPDLVSFVDHVYQAGRAGRAGRAVPTKPAQPQQPPQPAKPAKPVTPGESPQSQSVHPNGSNGVWHQTPHETKPNMVV